MKPTMTIRYAEDSSKRHSVSVASENSFVLPTRLENSTAIHGERWDQVKRT